MDLSGSVHFGASLTCADMSFAAARLLSAMLLYGTFCHACRCSQTHVLSSPPALVCLSTPVPVLCPDVCGRVVCCGKTAFCYKLPARVHLAMHPPSTLQQPVVFTAWQQPYVFTVCSSTGDWGSGHCCRAHFLTARKPLQDMCRERACSRPYSCA